MPGRAGQHNAHPFPLAEKFINHVLVEFLKKLMGVHGSALLNKQDSLALPNHLQYTIQILDGFDY